MSGPFNPGTILGADALNAAIGAKVDSAVEATLAATVATVQTQISALQALGALAYRGSWNANTNITSLGAAIVSSVGTKGDYYTVSTAGTTTINGTSIWNVLDHIVFNGSVWERFVGTITTGASGFSFTFDTTTSMANPGAGNLRFNNATLASVTAIAISVNTADGGNPSIAASIATWDNSTTTAHRGRILIKKTTLPQNFIEFDITSASTNNTTWYQINGAVVASSGSLSASDALSIEWRRTGDAGSGTVAGGTTHGVAIATGASSITSTAVMTDGQMLVGQTGADPLPKTVSGDATLSAAGALTVTKTGGTAFAASATTDATNASNISSGTLGAGRLPAAAVQAGATNTITKGYTLTPNNIGTVTTGTTTLDPTLGNYQYMTNNGASTIAAPSSDCAMDVLVTNGASAGALTMSGFTVGANTGSAYDMVNAHKFILSVRRIAGTSTYSWYALQ